MNSFRQTPSLVSAFAFFALGCGGGIASASGGRVDPHSLQSLYPFGEGYVWSYRVDTGTRVNALAVSRLVQLTGERATLSNGGEEIVYERRADGIYRVDQSVYVLKLPIENGNSWSAASGRTAQIVSITEEVHVPGGDFNDCVRVEETGGDSERTVATVFCPTVGPTIVESHQQLRVDARGIRVRAELLGFVRGAEDPDFEESNESPIAR